MTDCDDDTMYAVYTTVDRVHLRVSPMVLLQSVERAKQECFDTTRKFMSTVRRVEDFRWDEAFDDRGQLMWAVATVDSGMFWHRFTILRVQPLDYRG